MSYSIISILALILNLIINRETLKNFKGRSRELSPDKKFNTRYRYFLVASNFYFLFDIGWGVLYEYRNVPGVFPILYADCVLYFLLMFMTMLTWMRSIVAYLDKNGRKSKILLYSVWSMFTLGLIYLVVNLFNSSIFLFDENHDYVTQSGRHIAFILQIALYMVTTIYMLYIAFKSKDSERIRYRAVGFTCFMMDVFLILQILEPKLPYYAMGLIIGICVIHSFVEAGERREKEIYDNIAKSLAGNYEAIYYINIETGEYREFSRSKKYDSLKVPVGGKNFYEETHRNIEKYVHPDDREFANSLYSKETMLQNLEGRSSYSYKYRLMIEDQPRFFRFTVMLANDKKHFILNERDIDDEITAENMRLENQKKHVTFTQIAEILAVNYDVIYYVDAKDSSYISYECRNIYGQIDVQRSGDDFFEDSKVDVANIVHKNDRELVHDFINKDYIMTTLTEKKSCSLDYRIVAFKKTHYVRMTFRKNTNGTHYIIGIENIDEEIKKEKQHLKALNTEKELARRDDLTGIKNKTAYNELEKSVQENMDNGMDYLPFALVVCDTNNLKKINDSFGHVAGDEYIKQSAMLLCNAFVHSPVFRVGGDEFVVFLRGNDYSNREDLLKKLRAQVRKNLQAKSGPIVASGMAEYNPKTDTLVSEIFDRADKDMYINKHALKREESELK